jgi:methylase of polypeptide subunit release factors
VLDAGRCRELAGLFSAHDYTVDAVVGLIGETAHRALGRNSTLPGRRAIGDRTDPLSILTLLWPLQQAVTRTALDRALPGLVTDLLTSGVLSQSDALIRALVDIRPYASDDGAAGWVVSDLTPNLDTQTAPMRPDFVLGVSSASTTLAQLTVRYPVSRALDLGTGCGVQTLHLSRHCRQVVATDLNPRALQLARLTLMLNSVDADLRIGNLYEPLRGEHFDLIVSNPPYVMSPPSTGARLAYREGNTAADALVQRVVIEGADRLADGGFLQVLGNWAHVRGQDWTERIDGWVRPTGCDAHVVQRETLDVTEYIELWLADAGLAGSPDYLSSYDGWLDYFEHLGIEAVGLGWLVLRRSGRAQPQLRIEDWPHPLEQPIAPALAAEPARIDVVQRLSDASLLETRWRLAADVIEETQGIPGFGDPQHLVLRQQRGFRRAIQLDTAQAGIVGACDGDLPLGTIIDSVARLTGVDAAVLTRETPHLIRRMILDGFLV